ncbi:hypothetical protein AXE77_02255 [Gardnerella vaginalis]|uniref:Uncharacterized protein n=1 Tax=Gardnerella vaginalis TaxID=2702 RepID=A0A3E1J1U8_GARVA|nr:hypothetical protein AXE77_02255 [Gardnerella vaginalis]
MLISKENTYYQCGRDLRFFALNEGRSRGLRRARYETRVGSPLDFQLKRVSAPSCLRALRFKRFGRSSRRAEGY